MKKVLLILFLLIPRLALAQSQVTVTGSVNGATSGYVQFQIMPWSSSIHYTIPGPSGTTIANQNTMCGITSTGTLANPTLSGPCVVWGNDQISPGNTTYTVVFAPKGTVTNRVAQELITGTTYNLNSPKFAPSVKIVPQYQTITTQPISVNLVPAAAHAFSVGSAGAPYAAGYFDNLVTNQFSMNNLSVGALAIDSLSTKSISKRQYCDQYAGSDDGARLIACLAALPTGGIADATGLNLNGSGAGTINITADNTTVLFGANTLTLTAAIGINVTGNHVCLIGLGPQASKIHYNPSTPGIAVKWASGTALTIQYGCIRGIGFDATGNTSQVKTAIQVIDAEQLSINDNTFSNWSDSTHSSIGVEIQGRQKFSIHDNTNFSDQPWHVMIDPNVSSIGLDSSHWYDNYSRADSSKPVYLVDDHVSLTRNSWENEAVVGGTFGFYYLSTSEAVTGYNNTFNHFECEQSTNVTGACIYLSPGSGSTFSTAILHSYIGASVNQTGIYLRNQSSATIKGNVYAVTGVALNADSTVYYAVEDNWFNRNNGATVSVAGSHPTKWCGNDEPGQNATAPLCGMGVVDPQAAFVLPNAQPLAGRNFANTAEVPLIELDDTDATIITPNAGQTIIKGPLAIGGSFPHSHLMSIAVGQSYAGQNAGNTDSIAIANITANKPNFDPGGVGATFGNSVDAANGFKTNGVAGYSGSIPVRRADGMGTCNITVSGGIITGHDCP